MIGTALALALAAQGSVAAPPPAPTRSTAKMNFTHGSDIIARCTSDTPQDGSFCFGFVAAVYESVRAYETWLNIREFCVPAGVTLSDMRDAVVARIRKNPNDRLGQGASVVILALKEKWPCAAAATTPPAAVIPAPARRP